MRTSFTYRRKATAAVAATALVAGALAALVVASPSASADPGPIAARTSTNVTADALPTAQIDGVVWSQAIVGNTVYVGGSFANARPAGVAAGGTGSVARPNLMSYTLSTGVMTSWNPNINGVIKAVAASPDGSRIYIGGSFTSADGVTHNRLAAYSTATGALISSFTPNLDATVNAIVATNSTVYVGGIFSKANGSARGRLAAFSAANGAVTTWNPNADYNVNALVISPDGTRVFAGGAFQNVGGQAEYGLVATDATTGAVVNWPINQTVQDAGTEAAIESLSTDGTNIYGTGYVFGSGGNLEGAFNANPTTGAVNWIEDCHGDTYDNFPMNGTLYVVAHEHFCGDVGAFPQTEPTWTFQHTTAFTTQATGTLAHNPEGGYTDWFGQPSPSQLNWYPDMSVGSYTGQSQAAWTVTGNGQYLVEGGEFPTVNNTAQQGLVRFAVPSIAPNKQGPRLSGSNFKPSVVSLSAGAVRVSFPLNYDRDDKTLSYTVTRTLNGVKTTAYTLTADSEFWNRPNVGFTDSTVPAGATVSYKLAASDPDGNTVTGDPVSITTQTGTAAPLSQYAQDVKADGASHYWRLGESSGSTGFDWAGYDDLTEGAGVTDGASGAVAGDTNTAASFNSSAVDASNANTGFAVDPTPVNNPTTFTEEAWFQTTSTAGGKIVGFGNAATGNSSNYDRHIYMSADGKINFGVYNGSSVVISTPTAYNDGAWHQVVASLSPTGGMTLYVDGKKIGTNPNTVAQNYTGYWRIGGDTSWSGANYFNGNIDEVAIYPTALNLATVQKHFIDAGGNLPTPTPAPSDKYGKAVYADSPDLYYRLDDTTGTTAVDSSGNGNNGVYNGGETLGTASPVTGATGTAATFNGNGGTLASGALVTAPGVYSEELWFNTTTTHGGKLIGFGNQQNGNSSNYDHHVYMENDGQLEFGTWTGQENLATSPAAYNDGQWHYMVATQGPDGMKLYVDNQLVATNAQTGSQSYSGYWRIGGDTDWGGDSYYFAGSIDEAAVYSTVLTPAQIAAHYAASSAVAAPNQAPTAAFTSTAANLAATFDGSTSSDPDGTVASYAWNFGDGSTGTGANPAHTYAAAGTYTVSLTVTDNQGLASTAVTHPITVAAANQLPTAAFTFTTSGLGVTVNGTSSNDPDGTIASYAWDFGDSTTATGATPPAHVYASGATYPVKLTVTDNQGGTATVTQNVTVTAPVNQLPTAAFTSTTNGLAVTVDGSTSADSDGTIASYAWNYGDSKTDTGATPVPHTYAASGTYTVSLTVTDNSGGTNTITHPVTVTAPANQSPTAAFVTSVSNLSLAVNGSSSNDPDGTIANYAWDYGDGSSATGVTPTTHTYAAAGTYTVSLVVTDNQGATGSLSKTVTVSAPVTSAYATDTFTRTTASGFGTADLGGAWTVTGGASNFSVNGTTGRVNIATAGAGPTALLSSLAQANINAVIDTSFSSAATGGGTYVTLMARHTSTGDYRLKEHLVAGGAVQLLLTKVVGTTETTLKTVTIAGVTYTPGDVYKLRFIVNGDGTTTTLSGSLWKSGTTEPTTAQITATDTTASLQGAGSFGFQSYLSGSSTTAPVVVSYDNLSITPVGATPANLPPSAAFTTAVSNLAVTVNGSTSSDSDGSVASYAWNFGDGATATGATPTAHTYGAAGTYTISLTVTDNQGATNTVTHQVTVAGGTPVNQAPVAAFTSSVANLVATFDGSGSTDDGTIASYAWDFGDGASSTSMNPTHTYAGAGTFTVKLTVTDNGGLTNSVSHQVTTTAPGVTTLAADSFTRTAATGWGAADLGGSWTVSSASLFSVANGAGSVALKAAAAGPSAYLNSLSQANVNIVLDTSASAINSSVYTTLMARHSATSDYRLKQVRLATGAVQLSLSRVVNSVETTIKTVTVPGVTYTPGDVYRMRFVVNGNGTTTTLSGSLWKLGSIEPATPQITSSDTTASLQGAGTFGIQSYIASTATVFPVTETYDNLSITAP